MARAGGLCGHSAKCTAHSAIGKCVASNPTPEVEAICRSGKLEIFYRDTGYSVDEAIGLGRLRIDQGALSMCIDSIRGSSCLRLNTTACFEAYAGTVALAGACNDSGECANGYCARADASATHYNGCPGTCRPRPATSQPCAFAPCAADHFCNPSQVCERRHVVGDPCRSSGECESGLTCPVASSQSPGTCRSPAAEGELCNTYEPWACQGGLYCDGSKPGILPTCRQRGAVGDSCGNDLGACGDGLACVAADGSTARCARRLDAGEACVLTLRLVIRAAAWASSAIQARTPARPISCARATPVFRTATTPIPYRATRCTAIRQARPASVALGSASRAPLPLRREYRTHARRQASATPLRASAL